MPFKRVEVGFLSHKTSVVQDGGGGKAAKAAKISLRPSFSRGLKCVCEG